MGQWRSKEQPAEEQVKEPAEVSVELAPSDVVQLDSSDSSQSSSEPSVQVESERASLQPSVSLHEDVEEEEVEEEEEEVVIEAPPSVKVIERKMTFKRQKSLSNYEEILESEAAHAVIKAALLKNPPGSLDRWDKILEYINSIRPPTEEDPAPLVIQMTLPDLRRLLSLFFNSIGDALESEEFLLMRSIMERLYNKHSIDRCRLISQRERERRDMAEESYSYGEIDYLEFASIFRRIEATYGINTRTSFVDLGSGVGTIVFAAAVLGNFATVSGVENLECLIERAEKRIGLWKKYAEGSPAAEKNLQFRFLKNDFIADDRWTKESSFVFLHWTAFSTPQIAEISNLLSECGEGTQCVTVTHPIQGDSGFVLLERGSCGAFWGTAEYFVYEKT